MDPLDFSADFAKYINIQEKPRSRIEEEVIARLPDTTDRAIKQRFCELASKNKLIGDHDLVKDLKEILHSYSNSPDFFPLMNCILEKGLAKQDCCSEFSFAVRLNPKITLVIELLELTKDLQDSKLFNAIWAQYRESSSKWSSGYPAVIKAPNMSDWFSEVKSVIEKFYAYRGENAYYSPYSYNLYKAIVFNSKEPKHDLLLIENTSQKPKEFNAINLSSYYKDGHHYICHLDYFARKEPEGQFSYKRTISDVELTLRDRFSRQEAHLPLEEQEKLIPSLRLLSEHVSVTIINLIGECEKNRASTRTLTSLAHALTKVPESEKNVVDRIVTVLSEVEPDTGLQGAYVLEDLLRSAIIPLPEAVIYYESGQILELSRKLYSEKLAYHQKKFPEKPLKEVFDSFLKPENEDSEIVDHDILIANCALYQKILKRGEELVTFSRPKLEELASASKEKLIQSTELGLPEFKEARIEFFAVARELFKNHFGVYPYNTQIISALLLSDHEISDRGKGIYAQIKTGEGKSLIFAILAGYMAASGHKVEVITSNDYLATRDNARFSEFFNSLSLDSDVLQSPGKSKMPSSDTSIIYSTNQNLIFCHLASRLGGEELLEGKRFDVALVDEADNLCIDLTQESCRIATPTNDGFSEEFYKSIIQFVDQNVVGNRALDFPTTVAEFQVRYPQYQSVNSIILAVNIRSALQSRNLVNGVDYVVQNDSVIVVDHGNTERLKNKVHWSDGLHEFVALREGLKLPLHMGQSAQMSHSSFIKKYKQVLCISGTFGDQIDRKELKTVYSLSGFDVPTHYKNKREDLPITIVAARSQQLQYITDLATKFSSTTPARPLLIVCQSIRESRMLSEHLKQSGFESQLLNDVDNYDISGTARSEQEIIDQAGAAGVITVATSVAGRGADIIPTKESIEGGGIYTLLTFVPINQRVDLQARGRAGRQGAAGTSEVVASFEDDIFIESLPDQAKSILMIFLHEFGGIAEQTRSLLDFIRRAQNLESAILRHSRLKDESVLEEAFEAHVSRLKNAASKLESANSIVKQHPGLSWFILSSYVENLWTSGYKEVDTMLKFHSLLEQSQDDDSSWKSQKSDWQEQLMQSFEKSFNAKPISFETVSNQTIDVNTLASLCFQNYRVRLAWLEARLDKFGPKDIWELLSALEQKIGLLTEECIGKFKTANAFSIQNYVQTILTEKQKRTSKQDSRKDD